MKMTPLGKNKLGLKLDNFYDDEEKNRAKEYECIICKLILSNNFNLQCNHCICDKCIQTQEKCPIDNVDIIGEINAFNRSFIGDELLKNLKVDCIFKGRGCPWLGNFKEFYSTHLKQCKYNDYVDEDDFGNVSDIDKNDNHFEISMDEEEENYNNTEKKNILDESLLNKKRKSNQIHKDNKNQKNISFQKEELKKNLLGFKETSIYIFQQKNIINNIIVTYSEKKNNNKENDNNNINNTLKLLEKIFFEKYNNIITIDSNFTLDKYPYIYYFTEPFEGEFICEIEVISRDIKENKEISFGLTNINNNYYNEIITTNNNIFLFLNRDIIQIFYDSKYFYIYKINGRFKTRILFENNQNIRYYPTIILNNKADILKISHK